MDGNGGPLAGLQGYLSEIDRQDDELDSLRGQYMSDCKGPRAAIKDIMASAREAGINMKAFRELLAEHRSQRRHEKRLAALEPEDLDSYDQMEQALGEFRTTPLGGAALERAKQRENTLDTLGA
jgi:uncharacterized protein (UPF0335 family)